MSMYGNHQMVPSTVGHGDGQQCKNCSATDREIRFALGPNCPNAPKERPKLKLVK